MKKKIQIIVRISLTYFTLYFFIFIFFKENLFLAVLGFHCCAEQGQLSNCSARVSYCGGFSCCRAWALKLRLSCFVACEIFPDQGSNPSPARAHGFFTTEPPGKPYCGFYSDF